MYCGWIHAGCDRRLDLLDAGRGREREGSSADDECDPDESNAPLCHLVLHVGETDYM
jgi:hypothetical protein